MNQQKFASNVVQKCMSLCEPAKVCIRSSPMKTNCFRFVISNRGIISQVHVTADSFFLYHEIFRQWWKINCSRKFWRPVIDQQRELILSQIRVHLNALKKYTYGKHIVARVEKLVAAGGFWYVFWLTQYLYGLKNRIIFFLQRIQSSYCTADRGSVHRGYSKTWIEVSLRLIWWIFWAYVWL